MMPPIYTFDVSPVDSSIVYPAPGNGGADLYLFDSQTKRVQRLCNTGAYESFPRFSPDGKSIVFCSRKTSRHLDQIALMDLATGTISFLTDGESYDNVPAFSPDGNRIVFSRACRNRSYSWGGGNIWDHAEICVMKRDGSDLKRLTHEAYPLIYAMQFLSSHELVFTAPIPFDKPFVADTMIPLKLDIDNPERPQPAIKISPHKKLSCFGYSLALTPDKGSLIVTSDYEQRHDHSLYKIDLTTSHIVRFTRSIPDATNPVFSANHRSIFFLASTPKTGLELWQVQSDGSSPQRIADRSIFKKPLQ